MRRACSGSRRGESSAIPSAAPRMRRTHAPSRLPPGRYMASDRAATPSGRHLVEGGLFSAGEPLKLDDETAPVPLRGETACLLAHVLGGTTNGQNSPSCF